MSRSKSQGVTPPPLLENHLSFLVWMSSGSPDQPPWCVFSTVGVLSTVGVIMMHVGEIPWYRGGYLEYRGGTQYRGGYHDACGVSWVPWGWSASWGDKSFVIWVPPRYSWYSPTCIMISLHSTQITKEIFPTVLKTPSVLKTPHDTQDISPHASWYLPRYWTPTRYWASPFPPPPSPPPPATVLNTHYTVCEPFIWYSSIKKCIKIAFSPIRSTQICIFKHIDLSDRRTLEQQKDADFCVLF